jgi:hypothetical protein
MKHRLSTALLVCMAVAVPGVLAGCGGSGAIVSNLNPSGLPQLGELWKAVQNSNAPDTDGDYLPDDVEQQVGTDPQHRDTDRDGLPDNFEIFGDGYFHDKEFVPDNDRDAIIAARDADDDSDGVNDGEVTDTDGDGVANYLETYGYTYEWLSGRFLKWNGDPQVEHWFTDPLQKSTDQDAFEDGTEVSLQVMDVAVEPPGDDPLVPACPNIIVKLQGYSVTLEVGAEASFSLTDIGVSFHANYGESYTNTQSTSTAISVGSSVLDESNWSRARSSNPTDAARIKLFLKVHNLGTAAASNIVPTLTLRIGGLNVATFEPGNAQINMLIPGGVYPPGPGVYWVVDSIDTGVGITPLALTMDELRALERGAPVSTYVTQLKADVMRMTAEEGWVYAGDWSEYAARCDAVGATIRVETGDGSFAHQVVYSDDAPSAPRVTLRDALDRIGLREDNLFSYYDKDGAPQVTSLEGYNFLIDQATLIRNGWNMDVRPVEAPHAAYDIGDTVLGPSSSIFIKAPRPVADTGPVIHYASVDVLDTSVKTCVSDYQGVETVEFVDKDGVTFIMIEEMADSGFFYFMPDPDYVFDGTELVVATNVANQTEALRVEVVFYPQPMDPIINTIILDLAGGQIYANVTNPAPTFPVQWVRAIHPGLDKGFLDLEEPVNSYEDPDGWVAKLPAGWSSENIKIVAYIAEGIYAERMVSSGSVIKPLSFGSVDLYAEFDWTATDEWYTSALDLDEPWGTGTWRTYVYAFPEPFEVYHWWHNNIEWKLTFNAAFETMVGADFNAITRDQIIGKVPSGPAAGPVNTAYSLNDIFVLRTDLGNYAKLLVAKTKDDSKGWPYEWRNRHLTMDYVVFGPPQANAGADQDVDLDPDNETVNLNGAASAGANSYVWTFVSRPAGSAAALTGATTATPSFIPDLEGLYVVELEVDGNSALVDQTNITVSFPVADAGSDQTVSLFYFFTDDPIALDGSASTGAISFEWEWVSQPTGSTASLSKRYTAAPEFKPDIAGDYVVKLWINRGDGTKYESEATVTIHVLEVQ